MPVALHLGLGNRISGENLERDKGSVIRGRDRGGRNPTRPAGRNDRAGAGGFQPAGFRDRTVSKTVHPEDDRSQGVPRPGGKARSRSKESGKANRRGKGPRPRSPGEPRREKRGGKREKRVPGSEAIAPIGVRGRVKPLIGQKGRGIEGGPGRGGRRKPRGQRRGRRRGGFRRLLNECGDRSFHAVAGCSRGRAGGGQAISRSHGNRLSLAGLLGGQEGGHRLVVRTHASHA